MQVDLADVRRAIENDELVPCFQPVVELHTGQLAGFEVLARWQHPQSGLILPTNFISVAEENGFIGRLTQQIMCKAFLSAPLLPEPLKLSVNVSPTQLRDLSLPVQIHDAAHKAGFPLNRLTIEVTETGLVGNFERALKIARELKAIGCRLSLDDFGTGFSSLRHLQTLPFDELKVDRSFVTPMTNTRESRKIAATIIGLGRSLGLTTVAEGVETEEQAEMLLWLGCDMGQGWFYGRPMAADCIVQAVEAAPRMLTTSLSIHGDGWVVSSLEAQPAQRLAQLLAIYDGAPVGLCFLDRNLRYVSLNRRLADLDDLPISAHLGKTLKEAIPEKFPYIESYLLRALKGESIPEVEVAVPARKAGQAGRTLLCSYQPAFDEAKEVIGVSLSAVDITARKRTEEALRESEEHLRNLIELSPEIPWVMDAEGNNLEVSSRWTTLTGLSKAQTHNRGWLAALHPDDAESTMKALRKAMRTGLPIDVEYRVKSPGHGWRWMRSRGSPRVGRSGEIVLWYGTVEDIHERKLLQESMRDK